MKRLSVVLVALLVTVSAFAAERDALLTPKGTLFTIESISGAAASQAGSARVLKLTVRENNETSTLFVPESLAGGSHLEPSLAYDAESETLFVFWEKMPNPTYTELLFCSYRDGAWSEASTIDKGVFHLRFNLKIGITKLVEMPDADGNMVLRPGLNVHAIWWDETGSGEEARYAMISVDKGEVTSVVVRSLLAMTGFNAYQHRQELEANYDREIFRHPALVELPGRNAVEVVFADWNRNLFHRLQLKPRGLEQNGVLHVPVGVWQGEFAPPRRIERTDAASKISVITPPGSADYVFYYRDGDQIRYLTRMRNSWSDTMSLPLTEDFSYETGVDVLRKLAHDGN